MLMLLEALSTGLMACGQELWIFINGLIQHGKMNAIYLFAPRDSLRFIFIALKIIKGFFRVVHGFGEVRVYLLLHGCRILTPT